MYINLLVNTTAVLSQTLVQLTPRHLTFKLTCTVSYKSYRTHVVIYILVIPINEDTALSLGLCEDSDLIGHSMTCMLRVV